MDQSVQDNLVRIVNVKATQLTPQTFYSTYKVIGYTQAINDATVASEANGPIVKYFVKKGDYVQKGQNIAKIDDALLQAEADRLKAMVRQSQENYDRLKNLWEEERIGSEIDYLNAGYSLDQAKASLNSVEEQIRKTILKAPFSGKIDDIITETGETAMVGTPMVRLIDDTDIKVVGGVPARYSSVVKEGSFVEVDLGQIDSQRRKGRINFVSSAIDPASRTFKIEVLLDNTEHTIKIDAEATLIIQTERIENAMVLDQQYIFRNENGYQVFVVGEDSEGKQIATARTIELGPLNGTKRVVRGLNLSDHVITEGFALVEDQSRIRVADSENLSAVN